MGKDYQLRKNYYFCLSFLSKSRTQWQTSFNKKSLLEQIFRLIKMSFRNNLTLCVATVAVSCRDKLLMQNFNPATYFLTNASFRVVETDFLASTNHNFSFRLVEPYFFNESFIPAIQEGFCLYQNPSTLLEISFLLTKTVTDMSRSHFLKADLILTSENLFSSQWKPISFIPSVFFKKFFIQAS